ncbi:MAG: hypothetical protein L6Q77_00385 [Bacteroidetes bacterium]|nr:hypothetical protein [Bacteroidota bacterium]
MFDSIRKKTGLWLTRRAEKKNTRKLIHSGSFWKEIRKVVIAVPEEFHAPDDLKAFISGLKLSPGFSLYFWTTSRHIELLKHEFPGSVVLTPEDLTYNRWFLPEKSQALSRFDPETQLVIDLSMDFKLDSAYLWSCFGNAWRVGTYHFDQDQFFDVILPVRPDAGYPQRLKHIQSILNSLS